MNSCLAKDPVHRFADFSMVRKQLDDLYEELTGTHVPQPVVGAERNAIGWMYKGQSLDSLGRYEEALACYDHALALNPREVQAWVLKGVLLAVLGQSAEALVCYDRMLAINPREELAWMSKGVLLAHSFQRYREALACFEEAQKLGLPDAAQWIALYQQRLGG